MGILGPEHPKNNKMILQIQTIQLTKEKGQGLSAFESRERTNTGISVTHEVLLV